MILRSSRRALVIVVASARMAVAAPATPSATNDLRYSLPVDISITATVAGAWLASEALKSQLAPLTCRWCSSNALDSAVRTRLVWTTHGSAAVTISNVAAYGVAPLIGFGVLAWSGLREGRARNVWIDLLVTAQAVSLTGATGQLVRYTVGRQRPYAHAGIPNPDHSQGPDDANLSFFSGHTSITFSIAAAAGTVARLRGSRWASVIYVAGGLVGAATAYLRIAADQHYLTDVLTGAVVGTGVGIGVPILFHAPRPATGGEAVGAPSFAVVPVPFAGGGGLGYAMLW